MLEAILLKFGMWSTDGSGMSITKMVLFHKGSTELWIRKNKVSLFLSMYSRCGVPAYTLPCVLIYIGFIIFISNVGSYKY